MYRSDVRMKRDDGRFDWDVPLGRAWIRVLVAAWALPLVLPIPGHETVVWPWTGWGDASALDLALGFLPLALGATSWWVLSLERRRLRGALLVLACAAFTLVPIGRLFAVTGDVGPQMGFFLQVGWQPFALALGAALIVAGNRQQKRSLGRGIAPFLAALGGLALLAAFLAPVRLSHRGMAPIAFLLVGDIWESMWPLAVWLIGLVAFALLGFVSPVVARIGDPLQSFVETGISRLARVLPVMLPLILLALYVWHGLPRVGLFFLILTKVLLGLYAVVMLIAIGLARLLDDADPTLWLEAEGPSPEPACDDDMVSSAA